MDIEAGVVSGGVILLGNDGTGLFKKAIKLAEDIVNYGLNTRCSFDVHPDIHVIDIEDGATRIKMAQVDVIRAYENVYPTLARANVFVINHADSMAEDAQSTLLKILEDGCKNNIVIMCCSKRLLPTICNRCRIVRVNNVVSENFLLDISNKSGISTEWLEFLSDKREEWLEHLFQTGKLKELYDMFDRMLDITDKRDILIIFNALPEGNDNFIKNNSKIFIRCVLLALYKIFSQILSIHTGKSCDKVEHIAKLFSVEQTLNAQRYILDALSIMDKGMFTYNDYFLILSKIVF